MNVLLIAQRVGERRRIQNLLHRRGHSVSAPAGLPSRAAEPDWIIVVHDGAGVDATAICAEWRSRSWGEESLIFVLADEPFDETLLAAGADQVLPRAMDEASFLDRIRVAETYMRRGVERRAALLQLSASERRLRVLFEKAPVALLVLSGPESTIVAANDAAHDLIGSGHAPLIGQEFNKLTESLKAPDAADAAEAVQTYGGAIESLQFKAPDGSPRVASLTATMVPWDDGHAILASLRDITERRHAEDHLRQEARHDALTGLLNRRYFLQRLQIAAGAAWRHSQPLSLCICDVDRFKEVNDTHGHVSGDLVLTAFGKLIQEQLRAEDLAGRVGGDEFCIAFPYTPSAAAASALERIRARLAQQRFTSGTGVEFPVSASFGLIDLPPDRTSTEALIEAADQALYRAKRSGRNLIGTN